MPTREEIADYARSRGLSENHVQGLLANIQAESSFNPASEVNDGGQFATGLFQHRGPRSEALKSAVPDWSTNWQGQIDFALGEPEGKKYAQQQFQSPEQATSWFTQNFERPANAQEQAQKRAGLIGQAAPAKAAGPRGKMEESYPSLAPGIAKARELGFSDEEINGVIRKRMQEAFRAGKTPEQVNKWAGQIKGPSIAEPIKGTALGVAAAGARAVPAFVGGAIGGIPGAMVGGGLGEMAAQKIEGRDIDWTDVGIGTALGAFPGFKFGRVTAPLGRVAVRAAEGAGMGAGTATVGKVLHGEGLPTKEELLKSGAMGAAFGTVMGAREGRPPAGAAAAPEAGARIPAPDVIAQRVGAGGAQAPAQPAAATPAQPTPAAPRAAPSDIAARIAQLETENQAMRAGKAPPTGEQPQAAPTAAPTAAPDPLMERVKQILAKPESARTEEEKGFLTGVQGGAPTPTPPAPAAAPPAAPTPRPAARPTPRAQAPTPVTVPGAQLPPSLRGAKPTYNYGSEKINLRFESDLEKAAFIIAQPKASKANAAYLDWFMKQTGMSQQQAVDYGNRIKEHIRTSAAAGLRDVLIPDQGIKLSATQAQAQRLQRPQPQPVARPRGPLEQRPREPAANLQQILKQQDIELANKDIIEDARRILGSPNESEMTKQAAREKLAELGISAPMMEAVSQGPASGLPVKFVDEKTGQVRGEIPGLGPRTPEEMAREVQQTEILRQGAESQQPVGVPPAPMTEAEQALQARAFTPERPRGIGPVAPEPPPHMPPEQLANLIHLRALEIMRNAPPGTVMTMEEAVKLARQKHGLPAESRPELPAEISAVEKAPAQKDPVQERIAQLQKENAALQAKAKKPTLTETAEAAKAKAKVKPTLTETAKARKSRAKPSEELNLASFLKREVKFLPLEELTQRSSHLPKQNPGLWTRRATAEKGGVRLPSLEEVAQIAHQAGYIPEPTRDALLDALEVKGGKKAALSPDALEKQAQVEVDKATKMETESAADVYVDQLHGTTEPLQYQGKEYQGAERLKGGNLKLKDDPDIELTKAEEILSVERTGKPEEGFPWEQEAQQRTPVIWNPETNEVVEGRTHGEAANMQADILQNPHKWVSGFKTAAGDIVDMTGNVLRPAVKEPAAPMFEKTEAGMQAVMPGMERREVPPTGLTKKGQTTEPTELEAAAKPKGPSDVKLFAGVPLPEMVAFAKRFIAEPLGKIRDNMRTIYSPRSVDPEANLAQNLLTRRTGRIQEQQRFVHESFRFSKAYMDTVPQSGQEDFWHALETGQRQPTPLLQRINNMLRSGLDVNRDQLASRDLLRTAIDNYAPHQFDKPELAQRIMAQIEARTAGRNLKGPSYFLKQRTLPGTVRDILHSPENQALGENGLKLRYPNPVEAVEKLLFDSARLIHGHDLLKEYQTRGMVELIKDPRMVPASWREVEGYKPPRRPVFDVNRPDAPAVYVPTGKYYAPESIARVLNNYTRPGLLTTDRAYARPLQWLREGTGLANLVNLGMSGFHVVTTATNSLGNELARGIMSLKEGRPIEAAKRIGLASTYFGPFIRDVKWGRDLERIANDPRGEANFPRESRLIQQYVEAGGRLDNTRPFFSRYLDGWLNALEDKSIVQGGNGELAKGLRVALTGGTEGIMKYIVAPAKVAAFANRMQDFVSSHPGLTEDELIYHSNKIMDTVDDAFGLVNYDRWGVDRHIRDAAFLTLRAVGWTMGNLKIAFGGLEDLARGKITERSARFLGDVGAVAMTGTLINLAMAGKLPDLDIKKPMQSIYNLFNPEDGGVNPDGTPSRLGYAGIQRDWGHLLFQVANPVLQGDPMAGMQGLSRFATGKLSPLLSLAPKIASGKDYFGRDMVDRSKGALGQAGDFAVSLGKEMLPFSVSNVMAERKSGVTRPWWQTGAVGMTPPMSRRATESKFMRLLTESGFKSQNLTPTQQEHVEFKKDLYEKLAKAESAQDLLSAGKVTMQDVREGMKRLSLQRQPQGELKYALSRPGVSLDVLSQYAKTASPEEAPMVLRELDKKLLGALDRNTLTKERKKKYDEAKKSLREIIQKQAVEGLREPSSIYQTESTL